MRGMHGPHSRVATRGSRGGIYIHPKVPRSFKGITVRSRLVAHERTEYKLMQKGMSYRQAHAKALKVEHRGLSKKEIAVYEGKVGSIARHAK